MSPDAKVGSGDVSRIPRLLLDDTAWGALHETIASLATPLQKNCPLPPYSEASWSYFVTTVLAYPYTGSPSVADLTFNGQSNTLTCTSTGGPATTVTWRRNGVVMTLNTTHQQTQIVTNTTTSTYQTVLTIDPSVGIVGTYNCTVENVRGSSSVTVVVGETWLNSYTLIYIHPPAQCLYNIVCRCT